jgi:hypothetical protein
MQTLIRSEATVLPLDSTTPTRFMSSDSQGAAQFRPVTPI